jgi:hypothetical protein
MRFSKVAHGFGDDAFEYFAAYTDSQAMLSLEASISTSMGASYMFVEIRYPVIVDTLAK